MIKKEQLKQEAEEYISHAPTEGAKDFVVYRVQIGKNAFAYVVEHKNELCSSDWIKMYEGTEQECYRVVGYLDSAEPREKHITELEEINKELFHSLSNHDRDILLVNDRIAELEKENAELEKENVELLGKIAFTENALNNKMVKIEELKKKLTKAKDIMKRLVDLSNSSRTLLGGTWHKTVREAEDFLKESEVEK